MAQPFDSQRLELEGDPVAIATGLWVASPAAQASFSVSATAIAHVNASLWNRQLTWFDRTGKPLGLMGRPDRVPDGLRSLLPMVRDLRSASGCSGARRSGFSMQPVALAVA